MKKILFLILIGCGCVLVVESHDRRVEAENLAVAAPAQTLVVDKIAAAFNGSSADEDAEKIARVVTKYSRLYGVPPSLVTAVVIVESRGEVRAVSNKGAVGLMQVMPYMAREMGFEGDLFDIEDNIRLGAFILADNIRRWGYREGIQRYFWGNGTISDERYIAKVEKALQEVKADSSARPRAETQ